MPRKSQSESHTVESFIAKWRPSAGSERANSQYFLLELCDLIGVEKPPTHIDPDYRFERDVIFRHPDGSASNGSIDFYRRGSFVLESKQSKKRQDKQGNQLGLKLGDTPRAKSGAFEIQADLHIPLHADACWFRSHP